MTQHWLFKVFFSLFTRLQQTEARAPGRSLNMTPALKACGRKRSGRGEAPRLLSAAEPQSASYLRHDSVCFHYSYFMRQPGMKGSYFLHGGGQVKAGARVARLTTRWGEGGGAGAGGCGFRIQSIKTVRTQTEKKNISPESVMLTLVWWSGLCNLRLMCNKKNKMKKND